MRIEVLIINVKMTRQRAQIISDVLSLLFSLFYAYLRYCISLSFARALSDLNIL